MEEQDKLLRRATVARILADRGDMLVVTGLVADLRLRGGG